MSARFHTPDSEGAGLTCRPLYIPVDTEWFAVVGGALQELTKPYNWEQVGSLTPERASEIASTMLRLFYEGSCDGEGLLDVRQSAALPCRLEKNVDGVWLEFANMSLCGVRGVRVNSRGQLEVLGDDGETWETVVPPIPPVTIGATNTDKRCIAAASAAEVIDQSLQEFSRQWSSGATVLAMAAGIIAFFATLFFFAPAAPAVATFVVELVSLMTDIGSAAMMTAQTKEELTNILYCNSDIDASGVVTFDYAAVVTELEANTPIDPSDWHAIRYMLDIVGGDGLNRAGATMVEQSADCSSAECVDEWCYEFDFAAGMNGFTFKWCGGTALYGVHDGNSVNQGTYGNQRILWLYKTWTPTTGVITRIEIDRDTSHGVLGSVGIYNANCTYQQRPPTLDPNGFTQRYDADRNLSLGYVYLNWIKSTASGPGGIRKLRFYGTGANPFGGDNC